MARRYYRSRVRYIKPKKRWATNIKSDKLTRTDAVSGVGVFADELVSNSAQTNTPTPVIVKAGNFKCSVDIGFYLSTVPSSVTLFEATVYVVFVPQGVFPALLTTISPSIVNGIIGEHPEYIMAWRKLDCSLFPANTTGSPSTSAVTFSSRMKRNLNSGDRICLVVQYSGPSNLSSATLSYTCQYWTCAN